jgi:hypothetical protein
MTGSGAFSVPMRLVGQASGTIRLDVWVLAESQIPSVGFAPVITSAGTDLLGLAFWVTGVDLSRKIAGSAATSSTTTLTQAAVTTTRPGAMVIDFVANDDDTDTATPGAGQTELVDSTAGSATVSMQASYQSIATPQAVTHTWSAMTNAAVKRGISLVFEPARAA